MKNKMLLLALLICGFASAQIYVPKYPTIYGQGFLRVKPDSVQHLPQKDTTVNTFDTTAQIFYRTLDSSFWGFSKARRFWKIGSGGTTENLQMAMNNSSQLTSGAYNNIDVNGGNLVIGEAQASCCSGMGLRIDPSNNTIALMGQTGSQYYLLNTSTGRTTIQTGSGSTARGIKLYENDSIMIGTISGNYTKVRIKLSPDSLLIKNLASIGVAAQSNVVMIDSITGQLRQVPKGAVGSAGFVYRDSVSAINMQSIGAVGDGTTDNAAVFKIARNLAKTYGLAIFFPAGTYITTDSTLFNKTTIYGNGINSIIKVTSSTVTPIVLQDSCEVFGLKFIGTGKGAVPGGTITTQNGIRVNGGYNNIHDCLFTGITGSGVVLYETSGGVTIYNNRISNSRFLNCTVGIFSLLNDEYSIYSGNDVMTCTVGYWDRSGGNTRWVNNTAEYCTDGFRMTAGGNGDHNNVVGCTFNHNTNNLNIQSTTLGVTFTGCSMLSGDILIGSVGTANNVIIAECNLYLGNIAGTTTTNTVVRDCNDLGSVTHSGSGITYVNNHNMTDAQYATTGGNTLGATMTIGTNDAQTLAFETNNNTKMQISSGGDVGIGTAPASGFRLFVVGTGNTSATSALLIRNGNGDNTLSNDCAGNTQIGVNSNGGSTVSIYGHPKLLNTNVGGSTDSLLVITSADEIKTIAQVALASGTYTPTLTNVTNVSASTAYVCQYLRVGSTVTVSGMVDLSPTTGGLNTELGISLPIASALALNQQVGGTGATESNLEASAIFADPTNDRARIQYAPAGTGSRTIHFSFTYQIL